MMGRKVSVQPMALNIIKCGMITTQVGSIKVVSMTKKRKLRPGKRSRAKPKPEIELLTRLPMIPPTEMTMLLLKKRAKGILTKTSG